jgi:hypothetical protein
MPISAIWLEGESLAILGLIKLECQFQKPQNQLRMLILKIIFSLELPGTKNLY